MRIDSHQHFWLLSRGDYGWLTSDLAAIHRDHAPADLEPLLKTAHIEDVYKRQLLATAPSDFSRMVVRPPALLPGEGLLFISAPWMEV